MLSFAATSSYLTRIFNTADVNEGGFLESSVRIIGLSNAIVKRASSVCTQSTRASYHLTFAYRMITATSPETSQH